ncbi:MAG: N-formylglutamate deformylase [Wenzhouxiangella sp.]
MNKETVYRQLGRSQGPLMINVPHAGTRLPAELAGYGGDWESLPDTDWHVDQLVEPLAELGIGIQIAEFSRYVIDLNRPPDNAPLYPGAGTGLVPLETFAGNALYPSGQAPDAAAIDDRLARFWAPYHQQLEASLNDIVQRQGHAILLDAHSIASRVPRLFDGQLPDINLGFNNGQSCSAELATAVTEVLAGQEHFSWVADGRFKGGYITRHYGQPARGLHALQIEISQACYLDEGNRAEFSPDRAADLMALLDLLARRLLEWRP